MSDTMNYDMASSGLLGRLLSAIRGGAMGDPTAKSDAPSGLGAPGAPPAPSAGAPSSVDPGFQVGPGAYPTPDAGFQAGPSSAPDIDPGFQAPPGLLGAAGGAPAQQRGPQSAGAGAAPGAPPGYPPMSPDQIQQLLARTKPGRLQTFLYGLATHTDPGSAADFLQQRALARAMMPQQLAMQQQQLAYGQSIQDPALRNLYFTNPQAYAALMQERMKPHDTAGNAITTGLGPDGTGSVMGSVVSKPGETIGDAAGRIFQQNPQAPMTVPAGNSVFDPRTGTFSQAPSAPQVVTTNPGQGISVVNPNGGAGGPGGPGAPAAGLPRGVRNNNPWNLTTPGKGPWVGQVGKDGDFATFATPEAGAAAADRNLLSKQVLHGLNTIRGVIATPGLGWDPGNQAYAANVARDLGVGVDQPLNLQDPQIRARVLTAMKPYEIGRGVTAAGGGAPGAQAQPAAMAQGAAGSPSGIQTLIAPQGPVQLTSPAQRQAHGISPSDRSGYALKPDGTIEKTADDPFGPSQQLEYTSKALSFEPLKNYITTRGFLDAAKQSMQQKGGFADLNLIDMAGKSVNPTLSMRPNMIEQFGKERGWPDALIGKIRSSLEHGQSLDDAARNALYNTIYTNTLAHYKASKGMIDKISRDAAKYGLTPQDLVPDLQDMPGAPPSSYGPQNSPALAAARDAIRKGAPRAAVIKRLRDNGIDPTGL